MEGTSTNSGSFEYPLSPPSFQSVLNLHSFRLRNYVCKIALWNGRYTYYCYYHSFCIFLCVLESLLRRFSFVFDLLSRTIFLGRSLFSCDSAAVVKTAHVSTLRFFSGSCFLSFLQIGATISLPTYLSMKKGEKGHT